MRALVLYWVYPWQLSRAATVQNECYCARGHRFSENQMHGISLQRSPLPVLFKDMHTNQICPSLIGHPASVDLKQNKKKKKKKIRSVQNCIAEVRKGWKFRSAIQKLLTNMSKLKYCYSFKHIAWLSNFTVEVKESLVQRPVLQQPLVALWQTCWYYNISTDVHYTKESLLLPCTCTFVDLLRSRT